MNDLLEKAKRDYPKGTKFKDVFDGKDHICDGDYVIFKEDIYVETDCSTIYRCLYRADNNKWAEIIKEQETIPLKILNNKAEDIFHISKNGDIVLRGKVIANDIELSEILTNLYSEK